MKAKALTGANGERAARDVARAAPETQKRGRSPRAVFLTWLRKVHLYVGLWGAGLGLLFGTTGILMNHRAIMKIPVEKTVQKTVQIAVPGRGFGSPQDMAAWLQQELKLTPPSPPRAKSEPPKTIVWGEREVMQPERWSVSLVRPERAVNAEYFVGNRYIKLDHIDATPIGTLTRLHMSAGVSAFWVLLADTIAGGMILLSITGLLLWTQLHTIRTVAVLTSIGSLLTATWVVWSI
jgi:hypothetical protein